MSTSNTDTDAAAAPETFEYRAEMKQLLHLIVHSLYTHEEIFLRELISNASDALNKVRFRLLTDRDIVDADAEQRIDIALNEKERTLTVTDTGIGMTREDLIERIGTVASSGTLAFVEELRKKKDGPLNAELIGQFGVGFYAAFMVADRIEIRTRNADSDSTPLLWTSDGTGSYTIEESDRTARGTEITLFLKEDKDDFAKKWRIQSIIRKYSNFVDFPIHVDGEKVNTVAALWHRPKSELTEEELAEFYKFISADSEEPLGHLHLAIEGVVAFRALLFVPKKAPQGMFREDFEHGLHLYSSKVFIQDDCRSLLPEYLRFVRGVVDTSDLPLNVSREATQHSPVMAKIRKTLVSKLLGTLAEWAADEDQERFQTFTREFGPLFKSGLSSEFEHRDELMELIRFESTHGEAGDMTSLAAYVDRMQEGQKAIYYILGDNRPALERHPSLEYFRANDIEVLLMTDPVDAFIVPSIPKYKDIELTSIEKSDLKLDDKKKKGGLSKKEAGKLIDRIKSVLGDRVEDVQPSERLVDSVATLVTGKAGMDAQMERMMRMMDENFTSSKKVLEVNMRHPLMKNLAALRAEPFREKDVELAIEQIFAGAELIEGTLESPETLVSRMTDLLVRATTPDEAADAGA